jgi:hypothetical protein
MMTGTPPRILGWRLVLLSAGVGLLLSAASVVATHAMAAASWPAWVERHVDGGFIKSPDGEVYFLARERGPGVRAWSIHRTGPYWVRGSESGYFRFDEQTPTPDDRPAFARPRGGDWPGSHLAVAAGWPRPCAVARRRYAPGPRVFEVAFMVAGGLVEKSPEVFPRVPLWSGLFINTLFYAALVIGLVVALRWLRCILRRRRTRCVACGYDLSGGGTVCPECGCSVLARGSGEG